jgi:hypothetical protein
MNFRSCRIQENKRAGEKVAIFPGEKIATGMEMDETGSRWPRVPREKKRNNFL